MAAFEIEITHHGLTDIESVTVDWYNSTPTRTEPGGDTPAEELERSLFQQQTIKQVTTSLYSDMLGLYYSNLGALLKHCNNRRIKAHQEYLTKLCEHIIPTIQERGGYPTSAGPSKNGATTVLNLLFGVNGPVAFEPGRTTQEIVTRRAQGAIKCYDSPGIDLHLDNLGKLFMLYLLRGRFPSHVVLPCPRADLQSLTTLIPFLRAGLLSVAIVLFDPQVYHIHQGTESQKIAAGFAAAVRVKRKYGYSNSTVKLLRGWIDLYHLEEAVTIVTDVTYRAPMVNMWTTFQKYFLSDTGNGEWKTRTPQEHRGQIDSVGSAVHATHLRLQMYAACEAMGKRYKDRAGAEVNEVELLEDPYC
jgi:hypothetical protein